jgi:hypothetical protein
MARTRPTTPATDSAVRGEASLVLRQGRFATSCAGPNLGEGTNLRVIVLVRRAEPRAGHYKDGTWCDLRKRQMG